MVYQAKVGKDADTNSLQPPLVTQSETVATDLLPQKQKSKGNVVCINLMINVSLGAWKSYLFETHLPESPSQYGQSFVHRVDQALLYHYPLFGCYSSYSGITPLAGGFL